MIHFQRKAQLFDGFQDGFTELAALYGHRVADITSKHGDILIYKGDSRIKGQIPGYRIRKVNPKTCRGRPLKQLQNRMLYTRRP